MSSVSVRRVVAGVAVVVSVSVVAFGASARAATVSAEEYVQTVCGQFPGFEALTQQLGDAFGQAVDAYKAQPSEATATALRQSLADLLDQSATALDQVTETARGAGTPDVKRGAVFATALVKHVGGLADALHRLGAQALAIDVASPTRFANQFERVANKLEATHKKLSKRAKNDPAFENDAAALHPLVVFMTTDAETCPA
jgi:hypothetical protein